MQCLFLNLASHDGLLACVDAEQIVAARAIHHRIGDHELVSFIENLLTEAGCPYADLTQVACVSGPGGFTSLRIGVTAANTIADQLQIPSAGIHMSDLLAATVQAPHFLWLHSTKKSELFVRGFGDFASLWPDPTLLQLEEFSKKAPPEAVWIGELIEEHREVAHDLKLTELQQKPLADVLPSFLQTREYTQESIVPWYGRGW